MDSQTTLPHYGNNEREADMNIIFNIVNGLLRSGVLCVPHQSLTSTGRLISDLHSRWWSVGNYGSYTRSHLRH